MTRTGWWRVLVLVVAAWLPACGGGEESGAQPAGADVDAVRTVMTDLLVASTKDDFAKVRQHVDATGFLASMDSADAFKFDKLTKEEQEAHEHSCFNQLKGVARQTNLDDFAAISTAMQNAQISVQSRVKRAEVTFAGTDEKGRPVKFVARLTGGTGTWRLITCEVVF